MAQPLMLPGTALIVPTTNEQLEKVRRAIELIKSLPAESLSLGQIEDIGAGLRPLPKKPEPVREIPGFPLSTYNFLKRPD